MGALWRVVHVAALCSMCAGCFSISALQRAKTLGMGNAEAALEVGAAGIIPQRPEHPRAAPRTDFALRYGLSDRIDLGGRIGSTGAEFGVKVLLTRPSSTLLHVSVLPSVGGLAVFGGAGAGGALAVHVPVLVGFEVFEGSEIVLGARVSDLVLFGALANRGVPSVLFAGGSVGFSWGLSGNLRLHPEVAVLVPCVGRAGAASSASFSYDGILLQAALGVQFDT